MSCARTRPDEVPSVSFQGPCLFHRLGTRDSARRTRGVVRVALRPDTGILAESGIGLRSSVISRQTRPAADITESRTPHPVAAATTLWGARGGAHA
jgi:hypothetical protein